MLLHERLNDPNTSHALLNTSAELGELRLRLLRQVVNSLSKVTDTCRNKRKRQQGEQRKPPVDSQHQNGCERAVSRVLAVYMMPGPTSIRTLLRSFVARDIKSPVLFF